MIHPDTEVRYIDDNVGYGVVATKLIPKGTITWVHDELDVVFTPEQVAQFSPLIRKQVDMYCFTNNRGLKVLCWDQAKYVNHSFNPSCFTTAYDFEIAIRDIHPGEQLTDDYGYLNIDEPFEPVDEGCDRKVVYPDDLLRYHEIWDKMLQQVVPSVFVHAQPLLPYVPTMTWAEFSKLRFNPKKMRSVLNCFYKKLDKVSTL